MEPCVYLKSDLGEVLLLPEGQSVAGRNPDLALPIEGPAVSGNHAAFHRQRDQAWVTDLGSTSGTFVNQSLIVPQQWVSLKDGDIVSFGTGLTFRVFWAQG